MITFPLFRPSRPATAQAQSQAGPNTLRLPVCAPALVHGNLAVYPLLRPANAAAAQPGAASYQSLTAALADGRARFHEGDGLRETEVENLTDTDLFLAAGEVITGGWQAWTLGVDVIVPRRSSRRGRLALREFCLGAGRWPGEPTDRREVSRAFGGPSKTPAVPATERALAKLPRTHPGAVGFALAVGGTARMAHLYAGPDLFAALWPGMLERLLSVGSLVAGEATPVAPEAGLMSAWVARACRTAAGSVGDTHPLTPRVTLRARPADAEGSTARWMSLETLDLAHGGLCVHQAIVPGAAGVVNGR